MSEVPNNVSRIDSALRLIDRELWIITAANGPLRGGLLATWVSTASIDRERPILLAGISPNHFTAELVQASKAFAAHLLRPDQIDLAWNFARDSGRGRDKFAGLGVENHEPGPPVLSDCLASFDCRAFARYDAGDRLFFWADVIRTPRVPSSPVPCLREHEFFKSLTPNQRQTLIANRDADATASRPLHDQWRATNL